MVKLFLERLSACKSLKLPSDFRIMPENELSSRSSLVSCKAMKIELGIVPLSLLSSRTCRRFGQNRTRFDGRWPEKLL
jgi:hypothetical protein